jgi:hypothetical protein
MTPPIYNISLVNHSVLFPDADLQLLANILQIQATRDLLPVWGITVRMFWTPAGAQPHPDHWVGGIFDNSDVANALGYHDLTVNNLPLWKIFAQTAKADGTDLFVTASHENLEMGVNPWLDRIRQVGSILYAEEPGDPDEIDADGYDITIPAGWPSARTTKRVSNFVYPNWYQPMAPGPYDQMNRLTKPLQIAPGGYTSLFDLNNPSAGWVQANGRMDTAAQQVRSRPHIGSRRALRLIPRDQWVRSTYTPGDTAVPAQEAA